MALPEFRFLLARSERALASLRTVIGPKNVKACAEMMLNAQLSGALGGAIHDHLSDTIMNEGDEVWVAQLFAPVMARRKRSRS
jgi:hypothetical protein